MTVTCHLWFEQTVAFWLYTLYQPSSPNPRKALKMKGCLPWRVANHCHFCSHCVLLHLVKLCSSVAQVRLRCQKGIPPALRGRAWLYLSGGKVKKEQNQGKFQVREVSLSVPPHSLSYAVFWAQFIFKFHLKLCPRHRCYFFGWEPWCILHRTGASWRLVQLV